MNRDERDVCNQVGLTDSILKENNISASALNFDAGTVIFKPGDKCQAFLILCSGSIRVEMTARSGRDLTLYRVMPSENCISTTTALLNDESYYAQGVTESKISAIALPVDDFYKALQHSNKFARYVLTSYANRVTSVMRLIDRKASRDVMLDVSQFLVTNLGDELTIVVTQTEIAKEIGSAREVVSRKLRKLEKEGVLTLNRGRVVVSDIEQLKCYAEM